MFRKCILLAFITLTSVVAYSQEPRNDEPVKLFGSYENVKSDGEHSAGYTVDLWKHGGKSLGLIHVHRGLIGDPAAGRLSDIRYDATTRVLSFKSKVSLGMRLDKDGRSAPTRDAVEFTGFLSTARLHGVVTFIDQSCSDKCVEKIKTSLPRRKGSTILPSEYRSYSDWEAYTKTTLDFRGPRW